MRQTDRQTETDRGTMEKGMIETWTDTEGGREEKDSERTEQTERKAATERHA